MNQSGKKLLHQVEELFEGKKYQNIIALLTDEILERYNSAPLYAYKARALTQLKRSDDSLLYAEKAISVNPNFAVGYSARGVFWLLKGEYEKANDDFNKAIDLDETYVPAYYNRAINWNAQKEYSKAIVDYSKAIELDKNYAPSYNNRGVVFANINEPDKALEDYDAAIRVDENYELPYLNRGLTLSERKEFDKAINDFSKAIALNKNYSNAYYQRAQSYSEMGKYKEAIADYKSYIKIENNEDDYWTKVALSEIDRLKTNIKNNWYKEIEQTISEVKRRLIFNERCVTHYTSLSAASSMILQSSPFRLSEGAFLNDTSEGKELFKYLSFEHPKSAKDGTIEEGFVEKPFIGSFVADNKHNNLTLWRMYGKEAQIEAKGCALTINREQLLNNFETILNPTENKDSTTSESRDKFTFYKVAYWNNKEFLIPGNINKDEIQKFNQLLKLLKGKISKLNSKQKLSVSRLLNDIAYLFKSAEYQYEYEIRLVVQGVGISKVIDKPLPKDDKISPPRVYITMTEIVPVLEKITLGPKVEKADEWAAAFNYHIQENYKKKVEIVISHLPFK